MFSTKPIVSSTVTTNARSRVERARAIALTAVQNPYISAGGAGFLFLITLLVLIMITGDPKAGAPVVRISLAQAAASGAEVPGWREALAPEGDGEATLTTGTYALSETPINLYEASAPIEGSAVITIPGGGRADAVGGTPLATAPLAGMTAPGPGGAPLPIIGPNGQLPAEAYARPFTANGKPKVALVVGGLGLNAALTRKAIETLPPEVTLSFAPYAEGLQGWIDMARANGHEVLLEAPMEPTDYPNNDPGPMTLLASSRPEETTRKLEWLLSRATGYYGLTNYLGSRFMATPAAMNGFTASLRQRGLAFVDDGSVGRTSGQLRVSADRVVDEDLSAEAINRQLTLLEAAARSRGQALGSGFAYPVTVDEAARWAQGLSDRGFQLAPASALTRR